MKIKVLTSRGKFCGVVSKSGEPIEIEIVDMALHNEDLVERVLEREFVNAEQRGFNDNARGVFWSAKYEELDTIANELCQHDIEFTKDDVIEIVNSLSDQLESILSEAMSSAMYNATQEAVAMQVRVKQGRSLAESEKI